MIRGYVAVVAGDSPSADILPDRDTCKKTAIKLTTTDEDRFAFYFSIKGTDYCFKVIGNVRTVDKRNIASGILRIGFIVPNLDIVVSGNPKELETFVYTLIAVKDTSVPVLPPMCSDSTHEGEFECNYKQLSPSDCNCRDLLCHHCEVVYCLRGLCSFCCLRVLKGYNQDDAHKILNIWRTSIIISDSLVTKWNKDMKKKLLTDPFGRKCLCDFDVNTGSVITDTVMRLNSITVNSYPFLKEIQACSSDLVEIPESLGLLPCLTSLDLSKNRLGQATNWNWLTSPFLRENLYQLKLAYNELHSVPKTIGGLRNLEDLDLTHNCLKELPTALGSLTFLRTLHIGENKLAILPGWMYRKEQYFYLFTMDNVFALPMDDDEPQLQRNKFETDRVPSLFKTVARYIITNSLAFWEYNIPTVLTEYLEAAYICRCGSIVFPNTTSPVVHCWIRTDALAGYHDSFSGDEHPSSRLPIAIRCCSYECYNQRR